MPIYVSFDSHIHTMSTFAEIVARAMVAKIHDKWRKCEEAEMMLTEAKDNLTDCALKHSEACFTMASSPNNTSYQEYASCLNELVYAKLIVEIATQRLAHAQDEYNYTIIEREEMCKNDESHVEDEEDHHNELLDDFIDIEVVVKKRKTRGDILTPQEAIKSNKPSKNHKLRVRRTKEDLTKTKEAKNRSLSRR